MLISFVCVVGLPEDEGVVGAVDVEGCVVEEMGAEGSLAEEGSVKWIVMRAGPV
jgi:hypothetical protein